MTLYIYMLTYLRDHIYTHTQIRSRLNNQCSPKLARLHGDAQALFEMVGSTCALAENVSSKVRELDLAKVGHESKIGKGMLLKGYIYSLCRLLFSLCTH